MVALATPNPSWEGYEMSKYEWSTGAPWHETDDVTELEERILGILESAGIPTAINDQIMALVAKGEAELAKQARDAPEPDTSAQTREAVYGYGKET